MELRIGPNQIINIPVYFTPKITSETKIKTLEIYVYGFRNQQGKPVKSKIRLEGTVGYKMGLTNDSQSQNSTLDTAFCKKSPPESGYPKTRFRVPDYPIRRGKSNRQKQNGLYK